MQRGDEKMIETFEFVYQIFWLVFVLVGATFALVLVWSLYLYVDEKRLKEENCEEEIR